MLLSPNDAQSCLKCGKCTSGCDINRLDPSFIPHRLIHLVTMGMVADSISEYSIWKCSTCFTCSERCPQRIKVTEILWMLKEKAFKEGKSPDFVSKQSEIIKTHAKLFPISDKDNARRQKAGLPVIEEYPDGLANLRQILGDK
ncbi:MAG: 4Fe-4S dicluster domain-containing protein [Thermodesulfovibrionales bacterium]|nr:4Fe-4S dicluster domain-containing protein [Thermodesulfovibrionales bacterium]